jgi:hypothetical protein
MVACVFPAIIGLAAGTIFVVAAMAIFSADTTIANDIIVPQDLVISQTKGGCTFNACPVYQLQIFDDGTVHYEGLTSVSPEGTHTFKIPRSKVANLVDEFNRINFFSLNDLYTRPITDAPSSKTSIVMDGKQKSVILASGFGPAELLALQNKIEETVGIEHVVRP